jgi:hypothetical protein
MSTNIYNYDGSLLTTVADGSISTTAASIKFPGRGFVNYGAPVNENMLWIMQNFAANTAPDNPVNGQTWYDTANQVLKVYDSTSSSWTSVGGVIISGSTPSGAATTGDFWYNTATNQLFVYSGAAWLLLGPLGASNGLDPISPALTGYSTVDSVRISDGALNHNVWRIIINNTLLAIFSLDAQFTPNPAITGFSVIRPGLNLNSSISGIGVTGDLSVFRGSQNNLPAADNTYNMGSTSFRFANVYATNLVGTATSALSSSGIEASNDLASSVLYPVMVASSGSSQPAKVTTTKFAFNAAAGTLGINTSSVNSTLQVNGGIRSIVGVPTSDSSNVGYSFGTDGDTGMFSSSTGVIQMFNNGTETIRVTSTGSVGIGTSVPAATLDVLGSFSTAKANILSITLLDTSGTISWDASLGQIATVTLTNTGRTFVDPTNLKIGTYTLNVLQDSGGNRTITTWGSAFKWVNNVPPTLSTAPNSRDIFVFYSDGTNLYASSSTTSAFTLTATNDTASTTLYPMMVSAAGSPQTVKVTTNKLFFNASSGYFGINTATPSENLEVNGGTRVTSLGVGTASSGTTGEIRATNDITAFYSSDIRFKENIKTIDNALDKVKRINGVYFDWNDDYITKHGGIDGYFVRKNDIGVIAQEVKEVLPEIVGQRDDGFLAVKYDRIVSLLIEAVKEQQVQIDELKSKLKE